MNHKTVVPKLRFQEFCGKWSIKPLGSECNHISYGLTIRPDFIEDGIPLISAREITSGKVNIDIAPKISFSDFDKLSDKAKPKKGDVFLTKTGTIGFSAIFTENIPIAITQNIAVIRVNNINENLPLYILHYFKTRNFYRSAISRVNQSTIMDLQLGDIKKLLIPFPPLPEQQKIASFLSAVDEKIQQLSRKAELLEQYKKGVMQQLFSGKLRFKDENGNDYADWEDTFFADTGKILIGLTHTPEYQPTGRPFLSSKNISGAFIDYNNIQYISEEKFQSMPESTKPKKGDILFTRVGSNLGNPKVIEEDIEFGIFVSLGVFRVNEKASNYFMRIWMDSDYFWRQLEQKVAGGAKNNLNTGWLKEFKLNLPSFPEQQKIANFLLSIDAKIESTSQQITQTQSFKRGLLQQLFV
ncbi:restriction endonuclease subunit S [Flavobacterium sp. W22_SRS_FP1]|uniref:restriction endonuclease subunit S n=1 Tax=Flavobacterium sp. W22_SRS_FP1 TaxID=3240276 RepID=UPI003F915C9A